MIWLVIQTVALIVEIGAAVFEIIEIVKNRKDDE